MPTFRPNPQWQWVIRATSLASGFTEASLLSRRKTNELVEVRHAAWWFLKEQGLTGSKIGLMFGKNHTTVEKAFHKGKPPKGSNGDYIIEQIKSNAPRQIFDITPEAVEKARAEALEEFNMDAKAWEEREARMLEEARNFACRTGTIHRITLAEWPEVHYLIQSIRNGRQLPTRRLDQSTPEMRDLVGRVHELPGDGKYYRHVPAPGFLGGAALVEADRAEWEAAMHHLADLEVAV